MDRAASAITLADAISWLGPLFGAGGLTAIIVAYIGTRKPAQKPEAPAMGIQALLADHFAINALTNELKRNADAQEKIALGIARYCDLMDITQALDRLHERNKT